jgi:hypothetical protein
VVFALLVYRAHMPSQSARLPERSVALRARVVSLGPLARLDLLHLLAFVASRGRIPSSLERPTLLEGCAQPPLRAALTLHFNTDFEMLQPDQQD